ncbi:unnamed protein product, partial [Didymodactylos carnosus]
DQDIIDRNNYFDENPRERSGSLCSWTGTGFNSYEYNQEYRQQYFPQNKNTYTGYDTLFTCNHQRNELGIATISNTPLNILYY